MLSLLSRNKSTQFKDSENHFNFDVFSEMGMQDQVNPEGFLWCIVMEV